MTASNKPPISMLKAAWSEHKPIGPTWMANTPIANSQEDQPSTTDNPLWETVRWLPARPTPMATGERLSPENHTMLWGESVGMQLMKAGMQRHTLCTTYAWSIPTPGDLKWLTGLLDGRPVVEIGAGSGYWAWQLEQCGVPVTAYDHAAGEATPWATSEPYATVLKGDATAAADHPEAALLLSWPPLDDPAAYDALSAYKGDLLIYAGEGWGGCTADDAFFAAVEEEWEEVSISEQHVTWADIHCELTAYRRR